MLLVVMVPFSNRRPMRGTWPWGMKAVEMGVGMGATGARNKVAAMTSVAKRVLCCRTVGASVNVVH